MTDYYKKYLIICLNACLKKQDAPAPEEEIDWGKFYKIAKLNGVEGNIYYALRNTEYMDADTLSHYEDAFNKVVSKQAAENYELDILLGIFREHNIPYMLMKGILTRKLYPEEFMRASADIDIYYNKGYTGTVRELLFERDYTLSFSGINEDIYKNPPYLDVEMHKLLLSPITKIGKLYDYRPFVNGMTIDGLEYLMRNDDFYLFHFCHLAQHFYDSGAGIKFFMDIKVMRDIFELDEEYINLKLKKYHLKKFHDESLKLADYWFNGGECDETTKLFEDYVLSFSAYGAGAIFDFNRTEFGKRNKYISAIFPSAERMSFRYPEIQGRKYMAPVFWVKRALDYKGTIRERFEDVGRFGHTDFNALRDFYSKIGL